MKLIRFADLDFLPASHEDPKNAGVYKKILLKKEELASGCVQMINWGKLPPGKAFAAHYHESMDEIFVMVSGKAEIEIDKERAVLVRGDAVLIPAMSIHTMKNLLSTSTHYLAIGILRGEGGKTVTIK